LGSSDGQRGLVSIGHRYDNLVSSAGRWDNLAEEFARFDRPENLVARAVKDLVVAPASNAFGASAEEGDPASVIQSHDSFHEGLKEMVSPGLFLS
jgi:hypothetical protein